MLKHFSIIRKKPNQTVEEFRYGWEYVHGPLVAKIPGMKKYVEYHVHSNPRSEDIESVDDPIDGIAEMWFESKDAMKNSRNTPEYQKVAEDDDNWFVRTTHFVHSVIVDETVEIV